MVVPYGNPEISHARKHALDIGEYGCGAMTNSLTLGCDCKGAIHYMDASFANRDGSTQTTKNAICIHEEDSGILFKHTDFRDDSCTVTRGRKLIISQIFTAANYEYCIYWSFHQDGTIGLEIKLTGILNTYALNPGEDAAPWGTRVYPGVNAHNHQHLFCLRIDPNIDGPANSIVQSDATASAAPVGSAENTYGNAFFAQRTLYKTAAESVADYDAGSSRTWDMINPNKLNKNSGMPVSYKLVSREVPRLMPKEGSVVARRAGFAKHAVHVTRCKPPSLLSNERAANTSQTQTTNSILQVATFRRQAATRIRSIRICPAGLLRIQMQALTTPTSFCITRLASHISRRRRIGLLCQLSRSRSCSDQDISSIAIRRLMCRRVIRPGRVPWRRVGFEVE